MIYGVMQCVAGWLAWSIEPCCLAMACLSVREFCCFITSSATAAVIYLCGLLLSGCIPAGCWVLVYDLQCGAPPSFFTPVGPVQGWFELVALCLGFRLAGNGGEGKGFEEVKRRMCSMYIAPKARNRLHSSQ